MSLKYEPAGDVDGRDAVDDLQVKKKNSPPPPIPPQRSHLEHQGGAGPGGAGGDEEVLALPPWDFFVFVFFFTLVTGPTRSLGLELSDTRVHEP